jgi:hypothetical protein
MLTFEVEGHTAGDVVEYSGSRKVKARATARSILPFASLEIVVNGESAAIQEDSRQADGLYQMEVEATLDLHRSSWVAARVAEEPGMHERILPRGLTVFAHTNPLYYLRAAPKFVMQVPLLTSKSTSRQPPLVEHGSTFCDSWEKEEALAASRPSAAVLCGIVETVVELRSSGEERRGGASRCNAATDLVFWQRFEPPRPVAGVSPPYPRRGALIPISPAEALKGLGYLSA